MSAKRGERRKREEGRGRGSEEKGQKSEWANDKAQEGSWGTVEGPGQRKARGRENGKGLPAALLLLHLWSFEDRDVLTAEADSS